MSIDRQPGLYPEDLPPEKLEQLLRDGYTVSPNSGRLRKKVTSRKKNNLFSKRKAKKYSRIALWALLIIAFLVSLVIIVPEMSVQNDPKNQTTYPKPRR
jgi:hypothetical protein